MRSYKFVLSKNKYEINIFSYDKIITKLKRLELFLQLTVPKMQNKIGIFEIEEA